MKTHRSGSGLPPHNVNLLSTTTMCRAMGFNPQEPIESKTISVFGFSDLLFLCRDGNTPPNDRKFLAPPRSCFYHWTTYLSFLLLLLSSPSSGCSCALPLDDLSFFLFLLLSSPSSGCSCAWYSKATRPACRLWALTNKRLTQRISRIQTGLDSPLDSSRLERLHHPLYRGHDSTFLPVDVRPTTLLRTQGGRLVAESFGHTEPGLLRGLSVKLVKSVY